MSVEGLGCVKTQRAKTMEKTLFETALKRPKICRQIVLRSFKEKLFSSLLAFLCFHTARVTSRPTDGVPATDGLPSAADARLQRSELTMSAKLRHLGSREPKLAVRQFSGTMAERRPSSTKTELTKRGAPSVSARNADRNQKKTSAKRHARAGYRNHSKPLLLSYEAASGALFQLCAITD
jgi:hypothetical protein